MKIPKAIIILSFLCLILFSCSKEEEEVSVAKFSSPSFDIGHLTVKMLGIPGIVDSIKYSNLTKGVTSTIDKSGFVYNPPNNLSLLSVPLASGNIGDQVQCCIFINSSVNIGVAFKNITADSISTTFASPNSYCPVGVY